MPDSRSKLAARLVGPIDNLAEFQSMATEAVAFLSARSSG